MIVPVPDGPCWTFDNEPWEERHFPDRDTAIRETVGKRVRVFRFPEVCVQVCCRVCGYLYGQAEHGAALHVLRSEIKPTDTDLDGELFRVGADWLCAPCIEGRPLPPVPVPGQLDLF